MVTVAVAVPPVPHSGVWSLFTVTVAVNSPLTVGAPLIVVPPSQSTPAGRPVTLSIVAFVAVMVMASMSLFIHTVCAALDTDTSGNGLTVMVTVAVAVPQPGVWSLVTVISTSNVPLCVGAPLIVVLPLVQVTPVGRPVTLVTVALTGAMVISVIALFIHTVCSGISTVTSGNGFTVTLIVSHDLRSGHSTGAISTTSQ